MEQQIDLRMHVAQVSNLPGENFLNYHIAFGRHVFGKMLLGDMFSRLRTSRHK